MPAYKTVTDHTFAQEVLEADKPVLVDFWASWCPPCHAIAPHIERVAEDFQGHVDVAKLSVEENQRIPTEYNIQAIPTLLIFKNGEVVDTIRGFVPKAVIASRLNTVLESDT